MSSEIIWSAAARRALVSLPEKAATAIVEYIYGPLADDPPRMGHALRFEFEGCHSARRGDYRVIYRIEPDSSVHVLAIGHRSDIYRRR